MNSKFLPATQTAGKRLIALVLLFLFSFHQLTFANPIQSLAGPIISTPKFEIASPAIELSRARNDTTHTASFVGQGNWKGLLKYWGMTALQIGIQAAVQAALFILPGVGQALGGFLQAAGGFLQAAGSFAIRNGTRIP